MRTQKCEMIQTQTGKLTEVWKTDLEHENIFHNAIMLATTIKATISKRVTQKANSGVIGVASMRNTVCKLIKKRQKARHLGSTHVGATKETWISTGNHGAFDTKTK